MGLERLPAVVYPTGAGLGEPSRELARRGSRNILEAIATNDVEITRSALHRLGLSFNIMI
jgi:hypothetical protein